MFYCLFIVYVRIHYILIDSTKNVPYFTNESILRIGYYIAWRYTSMTVVHLWEIRHNEGITLKQLEAMTGLGKTTLNNIENGKTSPTLRELDIICETLNITYKELFDSEYNK